jgi:catechol 2,3-dioxygenase-like lactoylglutathione lyase family enzyme
MGIEELEGKASTRSQIGKLHHAGISTPDVDRLARFYCDLMGFVEVFRKRWLSGEGADDVLGLQDSAAEMVVLESEFATLELFQFHRPDPGELGPDRPVSDLGINHLCFVVEDLNAAMERLSAAGMRFHSAPRDVGDGPFVYGRDPDGNVVELWQTGAETEGL